MLHKVWTVREVIVFAVFQNEDSIFFENVFIENYRRNILEVFK